MLALVGLYLVLQRRLGLLVFWHQATEWTHDPERGWHSFLPAAVIEAVGLAAAVWPLLQSK